MRASEPTLLAHFCRSPQRSRKERGGNARGPAAQPKVGPLPSAYWSELKLQIAVEKDRQAVGFPLNPGAPCLGELAEWLNLNKQPLALKFVRPHTCNRTMDKYDRRDPRS